MSEHTKPVVDIKRSFYTMASMDGNDAEIIMYGDIVERQPVNWWTGEPVDGQFIIQDEFLEDLQAVNGCKQLTIRMNSCGGDAGVSILIHNRLRDLASQGTELICIVDGVAMSGGSLIMSACDTVKIHPSSLVMIHKCCAFIFGGYNADELRSMADSNDAWDRAQVAVYKRKCGLSETVISHMMSSTRYMTGREAIENGFANELLDDAEPINIAASADGRSLVVNGRAMRLAPGMLMPEGIPMVTPEAKASVATNTHQPATVGSQEGGSKPMAKTVDELRAEFPDLTAQLEADVTAAVSAQAPDAATDAATAERERIQGIDEVAALFDAETVREAKYGHPCSAQEMTYRAAQAAAKKGSAFLTAMEEDTKASGAQGVTAVATAPGADGAQDDKNHTPEQRMTNARAAVGELLPKKKEG